MGEKSANKAITDHNDLDVYKLAFENSMKIFYISKKFPTEEKYALTDQIRRSSRAVCANIAEAWRKRRYLKSFLLSLNNAEAEASETQTWIDFASQCGYLSKSESDGIRHDYDFVIGKLVNMIRNPSPWVINDHQIREDGSIYE